MTSKEFVLWLKGFTEGVHEFNITPKQWDYLKEVLSEVSDEPQWQPEHGPNSPTIQTLPFIQPYPTYPYRAYEVYCGSGSFGTTITTTPGYGSITIANPPFEFGSTSTAYGYPSGSAWSYTNNTYNPPYTTGGEADDTKKEPHNED